MPRAVGDPGVVGAIFTGRRGVGNAVCRNFLFPLGWPACGVNSSLPPGGGLRNFDGAYPPLVAAWRRGVLAGSGWDIVVVVDVVTVWEMVHTQPQGSSSYCARSNDARQRPQ